MGRAQQDWGAELWLGQGGVCREFGLEALASPFDLANPSLLAEVMDIHMIFFLTRNQTHRHALVH